VSTNSTPRLQDRYYSDKCKADDVANHGGRQHLLRQYILGLVWVMKYYYEGVPSWKWYYPFHYAPFASDLVNIDTWFRACDLEFETAEPFYPVEQLMAVLPEDSSHAVPEPCRHLMSSPESPILDFYPTEVPVDPNGKAMPWLWVVLLPFIDEKRLLAALKPTMKDWSEDELICNKRGEGNGVFYVSKKIADISSLSEKVKKHPLPKTNGLIFGKVSKVKAKKNICCGLFYEAKRKQHRSTVFGKIPKQVLQRTDYEIRRPMLNRGGLSIANMGIRRPRPMTPNDARYRPDFGALLPHNAQVPHNDSRRRHHHDSHRRAPNEWHRSAPPVHQFQHRESPQVRHGTPRGRPPPPPPPRGPPHVSHSFARGGDRDRDRRVRPRVDPSLMKNLRDQLACTIQRHKQNKN